MGQVNTEQAIQIFNAGAEAINTLNKADPVMRSEPNMAFGMLALLALLPMIAAGVVAWFKRHIIIGWVNDRKNK